MRVAIHNSELSELTHIQHICRQILLSLNRENDMMIIMPHYTTFIELENCDCILLENTWIWNISQRVEVPDFDFGTIAGYDLSIKSFRLLFPLPGIQSVTCPIKVGGIESKTMCCHYSISQEICTRFCCALLCFGYAIVHNEFTWSIYPYSSGLLCWHWGNR